jgi:hypothetical protein
METVLKANEPVELLIQPEHFVVNKCGFDFSMDINKFVIQLEASYTHKKPGIPSLEQFTSYALPMEEKKSNYIAYSTGFNYFIPLNRLFPSHEGDAILTVEWYQAKYFDKSVEKPFLTDILIGRIEDSFFDSRLKLYCTGMWERYGNGYIVWPKIQYDVQNGLAFEVSYVYINGGDGSLLSYYTDKDIVIMRARYEY